LNVVSHDRIRAVIRKIPLGFVATYGDIADRAGLPGRARLVGTVLGMSPGGSSLPWHRVVGAGGVLSVGRYAPHAGRTQRMRLEREGVRFTRGGRVDLARHRWGRVSARGTRAASRAPRA
jgi:methylated-DNA-protein-cysteine methyltransferase-like protein